MKQNRNQYTGASGITQREADTIKGCIRKLSKISEKKNLFVRYELRLLKSLEQLLKILEEAERQ